MAGKSEATHKKKIDAIKQRGLQAAEAANGEPTGPETRGLPVQTPVLHGEVLPPAEGIEPTRTALKRAMRAEAQKYAKAAIALLAANLEDDMLDRRVRQQAANDLLAWGFGKPATEIEAGDGAQMIIIQKFRDDDGTT